MRTAADALGHVNVFVFAAIAFVCLLQWRRRRDDPARWAALTFALLAGVALAGEIVETVSDPDEVSVWYDRTIIAAVVLFPYLLFRFGVSFRRPPRLVEVVAAALTAAVFAWSFVIDVPAEGEAWPPGFAVFVAMLLFQWTALSAYVAWRLWRAGQGQPRVIRYRVRLLAIGTITLSLVLVLAGSAGGQTGGRGEAVTAPLTPARAPPFLS